MLKSLVSNIEAVCQILKNQGWGDCVIRLSQGSDKLRVLEWGSSRKGLSDKPLELEGTPAIPAEFQELRHDQAIIATTLEALKGSITEEEGLLAKKLACYTNPFVSIYSQNKLRYIAKEQAIKDVQYSGCHWQIPDNAFEALCFCADIVDNGLEPWFKAPSLNNPNPVRHYFALTNLCNRACEYCSCHSDPYHNTHMTMPMFKRILGYGVAYEAQLEGGEPTVHPLFEDMVQYLVNDPLCKKIILCTNMTKLPATKEGLAKFIQPFLSKHFILKPSYNSHLADRDTKLIFKLQLLQELFSENSELNSSDMVINMRRIPRPLTPEGEMYLLRNIQNAGLEPNTVDYEFQQYGKGAGVEGLKAPFIIANPVEFYIHSPDGMNFGTDLIARAKHMASLS